MGRITRSEIEAALTTRLFGRNLVVLSRTGSTNDVAKELAGQGAPEGTVVVADEQTAGRGRLGRRWVAPPSTCLLFSILFCPDLPLSAVPQLTMLCSLATADAVEMVAGLEVGLKWPNDLVVASRAGWRKLAGVLTETGVIGEQAAFAVVGIGINVNVEPERLPSLAPQATSILAETGRAVDRATLLAAILAGVEARYGRLRAGESPHPEWAARLTTIGQFVEVHTGDEVLVGLAESVDEGGALLLRTSDSRLHRLLAGDVTLSGARGGIDEQT